MNIVKCDKCGKEIHRHPGQQAVFPYFRIDAIYALDDHRHIDLCNECRKDLEEWFESESESAFFVRDHVLIEFMKENYLVAPSCDIEHIYEEWTKWLKEKEENH